MEAVAQNTLCWLEAISGGGGGKFVSEEIVRNAVDTLYANIRFSDLDGDLRSIVVTSSVPNEGKSTVSILLAEAMAKSGMKTLLLECDLRRRSLAGMLNAHPDGAGLFAVLSGQVRLPEAVVNTRQQNLRFLDAEPNIPTPGDLLDSDRFSRLLASLERSFDYVVIDTPPLGAFVDAAILAARADATLLVVREGLARRSELAAAKNQLDKAGARLLGIVMNRCQTDISNYRYLGTTA